ncbi:hypothetical protein ABTZ78_19340 [Streptomyces bauhiniae]|uniref:LppU/SCO3897 family protein n=1 Tax=Streptomyces bauhiniae TaxID=2340725 RepID=UPI0033309CC1
MAPGVPYGYPQAAVPMGCQVCGAGPAAPVTVRGHQGMVVIMRSLKRQGVFCRTCALSVFREMQAETLIAGWWGLLSVVITPCVLLANLGALSGIQRMPVPVSPGWRPPLDAGKPVFQRPEGIAVLIPLGLLGLVVNLVTGLMLGLFPGLNETKTNLTTGSCARNDGTWTEPDLKTVPCGSADAQYRVMFPGDAGCEDGDYLASPYDSADGIGRCLRPLR